MIEPFYQDESVTLYNTDAATLLAELADNTGVVITDPPYDARTHAGARSTNRRREDGISEFPPIDHAELMRILAECGRVSGRWVVANLAYSAAFELEKQPPEGLRMMRIGVWVKTNTTPQLTGDRPAQGWEAIAYMHPKGRARWNGGGKHGNFVSSTARVTSHPTEKPEGMVRQFVEWFSDPGDVVVDPFAGSGTTLVAARDMGRRAIGCEVDPKYCEMIVERLSQQVIPI